MPPERIADDTPIHLLKSLGPKSAAMLAKVSLNLLWALESALSGEPWQNVARKYCTSLLLAVNAFEALVPEGDASS